MNVKTYSSLHDKCPKYKHHRFQIYRELGIFKRMSNYSDGERIHVRGLSVHDNIRIHQNAEGLIDDRSMLSLKRDPVDDLDYIDGQLEIRDCYMRLLEVSKLDLDKLFE